MAKKIHEVIEKIPIWPDSPIGSVEEIQGGWTNKSYKIDLPHRSYVLRVNGENTALLGINRQQECEIATLTGKSGLAPEVRYCNGDDGILVTDYIDGASLSTCEANQPENVERLAQLLRRIHSLQAKCPRFCPFQRATQWIRTARQHGIDIPHRFSTIPDFIQPLASAAYSHPYSNCLCHNDFVLSNILDNNHLLVIDWEHAGIGNPLFDLATLAMNGQFSVESEALLLDSYFGKEQAPPRSVLGPWKRAFDLLNGAFYLVQMAVSQHKLDYERGVMHHFSRLAQDLADVQASCEREE